MGAPRGNALEMRIVDIARPPVNPRHPSGECSCVLTGATADLKEIAALRRKKPADRCPDRLMVAMKGRRVEAAIGLRRRSRLAVLDDEFWHEAAVVYCPGIALTFALACGQRLRGMARNEAASFVVFAMTMGQNPPIHGPFAREQQKSREEQDAKIHAIAGGAGRCDHAAGCRTGADQDHHRHTDIAAQS